MMRSSAVSNEVKSLGVKFLYLISNTHQVFLVLGKHTSLTAALLIERFLLIIQQGGISFYNFKISIVIYQYQQIWECLKVHYVENTFKD